MHPSAARLYQAAKRLKGVEGPAALARAMNESPQTIHNWENRGVSKQGALKAENEIGCRATWLLTGEGQMVVPWSTVGPLAPEAPGVDFLPVSRGRFHFVPVVGQGAGGNLPERVWTDGDFPVGATNDYGEVVSPDPHAFIIQVVGPSMIPKYNPRDYALVEPGTDPDIEDDVLVRLENGQTLLKRLLSRRGHVRLGSYNDPEILIYDKEEVTWMYYVAYPVPARKIKTRL